VGVLSYVHPDGTTRVGLLGDEIEVSPQDQKRLDALDALEPLPKVKAKPKEI
jgi:hypothetical protein